MNADKLANVFALHDLLEAGKITEAQYHAAAKHLDEAHAAEGAARMSLEESGLPLSIADAIREKVEALAGKAFPPTS